MVVAVEVMVAVVVDGTCRPRALGREEGLKWPLSPLPGLGVLWEPRDITAGTHLDLFSS